MVVSKAASRAFQLRRVRSVRRRQRAHQRANERLRFRVLKQQPRALFAPRQPAKRATRKRRRLTVIPTHARDEVSDDTRRVVQQRRATARMPRETRDETRSFHATQGRVVRTSRHRSGSVVRRGVGEERDGSRHKRGDAKLGLVAVRIGLQRVEKRVQARFPRDHAEDGGGGDVRAIRREREIARRTRGVGVGVDDVVGGASVGERENRRRGVVASRRQTESFTVDPLRRSRGRLVVGGLRVLLRVRVSVQRHDVHEYADEIRSALDDVRGPSRASLGVRAGVDRIGHLREDDERVSTELADHLATRHTGVRVGVRVGGGGVERGRRVDGRRRPIGPPRGRRAEKTAKRGEELVRGRQKRRPSASLALEFRLFRQRIQRVHQKRVSSAKVRRRERLLLLLLLRLVRASVSSVSSFSSFGSLLPVRLVFPFVAFRLLSRLLLRREFPAVRARPLQRARAGGDVSNERRNHLRRLRDE